MNSAKFPEMSREDKDELAERRMHEMKLKNEKFRQRYEEVENDRINAESQNSAVTSAKVSSGNSFRRVTNVPNQNKFNEENKTEHAREWDRGKPNLDDWNQPEPARRQYRNFGGSGRYERKEVEKTDNRSSYSHHDRRAKGEFNADEQLNRGGWQNPPLKAPYKTYYKAGTQGDPVDDWNYGKEEKYPPDDWNVGKKDRYSSDDWNAEKRSSYKGYNKNEGREYASDNRKSQENWRSKPSDRNQYNSSRFQVSPRRTRGIGYRNDSHRKYQNYHSDDKFKKSDFKHSSSRKKYSQKTHSRSSSKSESDGMENRFSLRTYNLWQNDKSNEDQTKQTRVEKWVKSVNKSNMWAEKQVSAEEKDNYGNRISSEKRESSRKSLTKFDRIKISSEKDSDEDQNLNDSEDMKMKENKDFISHQYNYKQNSSINTVSSPNSEFLKKNEQPNNKQNSGQNTGYSSNSEFVKKTVGHYKRGFQSKHSPPFRSGGGSVNESVSKQKRDTRSYKSDDVKNKYKFKPSNNISSDDKWKSSRNKNIVNKNCAVDQRNYDIVDSWNVSKPDADGLWGGAEQSNIKWNLSDEESNVKEPKLNEEQKKQADLDDTWNNCTQAAKRSDGWSDVDQSDTEWKNNDDGHMQKDQDQYMEHVDKSTVNDAVQGVAKSDLGDARKQFKDDDSSTKELSDKDNESCELISPEKSDKDVLSDIKEADCATASPSGSTNIQQQESFKEDNIASEAIETITVSLVDEKRSDVSTHERVCSDDGGWSTVSEEGEVE